MNYLFNKKEYWNITHTDLDGVSCGLLIKSVISPKCLYTENVNYDKIDEKLKDLMVDTNDLVIITDILPRQKESLQNLLDKGAEVLVIDHHVGSQWVLDISHPRLHVIHNINKSATMLTYEWLETEGFNMDALGWKQYVMAVNSHDLWLQDNPLSIELNQLLHLLGQEKFEARFSKSNKLEFSDSEKLLLELETLRKNEAIQGAFSRCQYYTDVKGRRYALIYINAYASEIGNAIASQGDVDYVCLVMMHITPVAGNPGVVSLRSIGKADCNEIAHINGGGGHKNAAGFFLKDWQPEYFGIDIRINI